ncbi:MAG: triose-phosphate isomerase [Gammaproteobacteria bacterium]|nr:triose-phosphate isomerase [Gammaproteobacteria bacterium]MDH5800469.1 triose-phosphate isomerase [Gammaproteobacteria bacterium]
MRQPLVAGNWKLNGSKENNKQLLEAIMGGSADVKNAEIAVCPPFVYLQQVADMLKGSNISYGSQNICEQESGAFTGEVAAAMLNDFGCKYAIIGHSERRSIYGESDALIAQKFVAAKKAAIIPILCVGELLEERESGQTEAVVGKQLDAVLDLAGIEAFSQTVIAYEPVWAIGTGKTASPEQAQDVHAFIRARLATKNADVAQAIQILYGGSVKADNAADLFAREDIDGGLIGGASLQAESFLAICKAAG